MCEVENLMREILTGISGNLGEDTTNNIFELLVSGEPGVALEVLCVQLLEFDVPISSETKNSLMQCAKLMKMEVGEIDQLRAV